MLCSLLMCVFSMVSVAFFTLVERKVLGLGQSRKGPDKVSNMGILQPFADVLKLFTKFAVSPVKADQFLFWTFPLFNVSVFLTFWSVFPLSLYKESSVILFAWLLGISSLTGLAIIFSGWSGTSSFSVLGSMRAVVQFLSYEVILSFIWFGLFYILLSYDVASVDFGFSFSLLSFFWVPLFFLFFLVILAESQRAPFDFAEGESELVSGFNTEFSSVLFAFIFLSEYGLLMFMGSVVSLSLIRSSFLFVIFFTGLIMILVVCVRAIVPRLRYDILQNLAWKVCLPLSILFFMFIIFG